MWFIFAIVTTLLWGFAELFYKKGARPDEDYSHLRICVCVGLVMGIHAVVTLLTGNIGYEPVNLLRYLPVSLMYILSMTFSFFGMRFIEESISDPIENTSGMICTLLCVIFLGESLSPLSAFAICLTVIGILGIGFLENRTKSFRTGGNRTAAAVAFAMPFVYAVLDAFGSFLDVFYLDDPSSSPLAGVTEQNIEAVANTSYELTFAFFALVIFVFLRIRGVPFELPRQGDKLLAAVCETGGQLTYVYAMSGNGAIAAPIISSVCVVSLLLSRIILREKLSRKQYAFIVTVIAGILLLAVTEGE